MELTVTQEIHDAARAEGACSVPPVGTPIKRLQQYQVLWAYTRIPHLLAPLEPPADIDHVPLWGLVQSGSGCGSGDGYGSGYGYGDGSGYGYGYGYGNGYGDGYGDGSGYGYDARYSHLLTPREITLP